MTDAEEYVKWYGGLSFEFESHKDFIKALEKYDKWRKEMKSPVTTYDTSPEALERWLRGFNASREEVNHRVDELERRLREHTHPIYVEYSKPTED